jgi:RHS repeat-associated protein
MVSGIGPGSNKTDAALTYTPEHHRSSLTYNGATMNYLSNPAGADMEEMVVGSPNSWRTYVYAYGHIVAEFLNTTGGTITPYYFVGDHLYSTTGLSDGSGNQLEYDSYDAWGQRRLPNGVDESTGCGLFANPPSKTLRGFTGQEEMDAFCLVNLNARIYDPTFGRILSADPTVPDAMNGQAYNRYSYVENDPLGFTDPTGYDGTDGTNDEPHVYCYDGCPYNALIGAQETVIVWGNSLDRLIQATNTFILNNYLNDLEALSTLAFGGDSKSSGGNNSDKKQLPPCRNDNSTDMARSAIKTGATGAAVAGLGYFTATGVTLLGGGPEDPVSDALAANMARLSTNLGLASSELAFSGGVYLAQNGMPRDAVNTAIETGLDTAAGVPDDVAPELDKAEDAALGEIEDDAGILNNTCQAPAPG